MGYSLSTMRWVLACLALSLTSAAPAAASTVSLGQTAPPGTAPSACAGCTALQQASGTSPAYTVPAAGTLTSWSIQGSPSPVDCVVQCLARLRILRPDGSGHYVVAAQSAQQAIPANALSSFPVSIPVLAGDVLGLEGTQVPVSYAGAAEDVVGTVTGLPILGSLIDGLGGLPLSLDPSSLLNVSVVVDVGDPAGSGPPPGSGGGTSTTTSGSGQGQSSARFAGVRLSRRALRVGRSGRVRIPVSCPAQASGSCRGTLTLVTVHAVSAARTRLKLASGRFDVLAGRTRSVLVRISRSGRRALRKRHRLSARLTASARDGSGQLRFTSHTLTVAQPKRARTTR